MQLLVDSLSWVCLVGGGVFLIAGAIGILRFPDFYSRLHALGVCDTMGAGLMLLGLIFRGVAFEFRFKAEGKSRRIWDYAFHFGSLVDTFMQGMVLGTFVHGIAVDGRSYAGGAFDWLNAFSVMVGVALVTGYALLGATWVIMKAEGETQA